MFLRYRNDPVAFVYDWLIRFHPTIRNLVPDQVDLLNAIRDHRMVSIRSGTGTAKTTTFGFAGLWFLVTRPFSLVPCTGPKADQLRDTLWAEIQRWLMYSPLRNLIRWESERISHGLAAKKETWCMVARTASEPQNLAGFHADSMLFIADEGSAIKDNVFEIIMASCTKDDNRLVTGGQPFTTRGFYFNTHHRDKDQWKTLHFDSEKSPLADQAHIARMKRTYGEESDIYQVRVKGNFPSGNPEAFIQYADVMLAVHREVAGTGPFELGVDVARFGDDLTTICTRQANHCFPIEKFSKLDNVQVAARVIQTVRDAREKTKYSGPVRVKVDDTGVGGGVTDILKRNREDKLIVIPVNFGESPKDGVHADMASALMAEFKKQLPYIELPNDEDLVEELSARRRLPGPMIKIEPKDRFKADYGRSPDRGDCVILAFGKGAEKKRVWPGFHSWNLKQCWNFQIQWKSFLRRNAQIYITVYQEKDLTTSVLSCLWDGQEGKLYLLDEVVAATPRPELIVPRLFQSFEALFKDHEWKDGPKPDFKRFIWYGNVEMFGMADRASTMKSMRDGTARAFEMGDVGIFLQPNLMYDEAGAISMAGTMLGMNRIAVHTRCEETIAQFSEWRIENGRPVGENNGLCLSLCNIVSLLHQWGETKTFLKKLEPYSLEKEDARKLLEQHEKEGRLSDYERVKMKRFFKQKIKIDKSVLE